MEKDIESTVPMSCFGVPEDIADAVTILCSKRARFIKGSLMLIDGDQGVRGA